jgi:elongation factor 2
MKFSDVIEAYHKGESSALQQFIPLHTAILDMVVKNLPNPIEAQKYRIPKIWKGDIDSELGQAMMHCDDNGPTVMCITMAQMDPHAGLVATGRLFSGRINEAIKYTLSALGNPTVFNRFPCIWALFGKLFPV